MNKKEFDAMNEAQKLDEEKYITIEEAQELYEKEFNEPKHTTTIRKWAAQYDLGVKIGGQWKIKKGKFETFLKVGVYE